jgi:hypothetical protein
MKLIHFFTKEVFSFGAIGMMLVGSMGCKKFVQIKPPISEIAAATVFADNTSAEAAMTGIYSNMMNGATSTLSSGNASISYCQGLAADELTDYNSAIAVFSQFYKNELTSSNGGASNDYYWSELYSDIYAANSVIQGLESSASVTTSVKQQLMGEALFVRAFMHFYAVNLYGPVPIVTTTNYQTNNTIHRSPVNQVYEQILKDLEAAQADLSANFVDQTGLSTSERTRPNQGAATALLARTFLYTGQWDSAKIESSMLINNGAQYSLLPNLSNVFLANSTEAIWQLEPVDPGYNTFDGYYFILTSAPGNSQFSVALSSYLLQAFEPGDLRYQNWIDSIIVGSTTYYYPYKYKVGTYNTNNPVTEYTMVFRFAEQYLIRAEAEANMGDSTDAISDLDVIRTRAGLANYDPTINSPLLGAILHERQVELFTEWGHRWFDLIRTGNISTVLGSPGNICQAKGGNWNVDWELLPLPLSETQINSNLTQNAGY